MRKFFVLVLFASLAGCGGGDSGSTGSSAALQQANVSPAAETLPPAVTQPSKETRQSVVAAPQAQAAAETSDIAWIDSQQGVTPFISIVHLAGQSLAAVRTVRYEVKPKPGSVSQRVRVTYTRQALKRRGRLTDSDLRLPVFGLYAGYANTVSIRLTFNDGSLQTIDRTLTTAAYTDPNGAYDRPVFIKSRAAGSTLGFDYFAMKSGLGTPVIVDTDGAIRWVGVSSESSIPSVFTDNGFVIGDRHTTKVRRLELDGTDSVVPLQFPSGYIRFHHNIDLGKAGLLGNFDLQTGVESTIAEFSLSGGVLKTWNFATIVRNHMRNGGDDPTLFVRPRVDWFHTNAAAYDPRDNSLIVSAREHFVMNVDYETGAIRWLLGDPNKYWWTFPSLRAKALTLTGNGLYPIGQHAVSITSDGLLLLFNAGNGSDNQPGGVRGLERNYSAVSAYRIDAANKTATEVWRFDYNQSVYSDHCSSVYESPGQSFLISYARAEAKLKARLVGLNSQHQVVFDFQYDSHGCDTSWNAVPIPLQNMRFE